MKRLHPDIIFESTHLSSNLAGKSVRGGMVTMGSQGVRFVLQMVSTMVLARLLTPADYGLIGMVSVVVAFATMFKDAGLSMATVQKDNISHEQISTLFWINVLISVVLGVCVLLGSPLVAAFYGKPELTAVTAILSISFIISGLSIQHAALLRRHMRFGNLAILQIVTQTITVVVTILLALYGWRYWALVGGSLTTAFATVILTFFFCPWIPGRMQKGTGIRDMLKFGGYLTGFNFLNFFSRNLDNILIGKYLSVEQLGYYSKAYQLLMFPLQQIRAPITQVAIPVLSRLQNSPERYRRAFLSIQEKMCILMVPFVGILAGTSDWIIQIILGEQWLPASPIFLWLSMIAVFQTALSGSGWLFVTQGRTKEMMQWGIIGSILNIISFIVGLKWGAVGVAASYSISGVFIRTPIYLWWACRRGPVSIRVYFTLIVRYLSPAILIYLFIQSFRLQWPDMNPFCGLLLSFGIYFLVGVVMVIINSHTRSHLKEMLLWVLQSGKRSLI